MWSPAKIAHQSIQLLTGFLLLFVSLGMLMMLRPKHKSMLSHSLLSKIKQNDRVGRL